jgi:hypothetical protein
MGPRSRFQGMNSASQCSLAGRYDNPLPPRFLAPIDSLKIPAQSGPCWGTKRRPNIAKPCNFQYKLGSVLFWKRHVIYNSVFLSFFLHGPVPDTSAFATRARILKLVRSPRIDSKESIPPAYVACGGPVRQPYSYSVPSPNALIG